MRQIIVIGQTGSTYEHGRMLRLEAELNLRIEERARRTRIAMRSLLERMRVMLVGSGPVASTPLFALIGQSQRGKGQRKETKEIHRESAESLTWKKKLETGLESNRAALWAK